MTHIHNDATVDDRFRSVAALFTSYLAEEGFSAQLSVRWRGEPVVDIAGGPAVTMSSITGVYSVSKGVAALALATLFDDGRLVLDEPVATYWPEFAANGKESVTVRQLLSHQAGLPVVEGMDALRNLLASELGARRLATQRPLWRPGAAFGYHAATIGILMEELVRRVAGKTLQELYEERVRAPREADFFLGLPESEEARYVPVANVRPTSDQAAELGSRPPLDALAERVFNNFGVPDDRSAGGFSTNNVDMRRAGPAAVGGVGSARGLARLYADALPTADNPIASAETFEAMAQQQVWGADRTLNVPNAFGVVFMIPQPRMPFAGLGAFGHDGAGGALAFADPSTGISFGYIPVPMQYPGGADFRSLALARLVRQIVTAEEAGAARAD
jgi:CubicO group peptidase (beta-lactamase class C family)